MIVRIFRGLVRPGMQGPYSRFLHDEAFPEFRAHPGLVSLQVSTPTEGDREQILVTSVWTGLDRVVSFAGERWREAKIVPGEAEFLRSKDVHHYETIHYETIGPEITEKPPAASGGTIIDVGVLRVDLARKVATVGGETLELPPLEFGLLAELALRPDEPIPAAELALRVWPPGAYFTADDLRRVVYRLRSLVGDRGRPTPLIRHRRGYGYLLDTSSSPERES